MGVLRLFFCCHASSSSSPPFVVIIIFITAHGSVIGGCGCVLLLALCQLRHWTVIVALLGLAMFYCYLQRRFIVSVVM
jgi:hypothetical protein